MPTLETEAPNTEAPTTKKVVKAGGKGKTVKKAAKKAPAAAKKATNGEPRTEPTGNQIKILKAIKKSKTESVTYADIRKATGIKRGLVKLVAAESSKGTKHAGSLEDLGLVKMEEIEHVEGGPRARFSFKLTANGRKLAEAN